MTISDNTQKWFCDLDLTNADFSYRDLEGADFRGTNLTRTDFTGSTLTNVDFSKACIHGACFNGTNLYEADNFYKTYLDDIICDYPVYFETLVDEEENVVYFPKQNIIYVSAFCFPLTGTPAEVLNKLDIFFSRENYKVKECEKIITEFLIKEGLKNGK